MYSALTNAVTVYKSKYSFSLTASDIFLNLQNIPVETWTATIEKIH